MNKRKQFALNKLFNFCVVLGLFFACGSIGFFIENDAVLGLGFGICSRQCAGRAGCSEPAANASVFIKL